MVQQVEGISYRGRLDKLRSILADSGAETFFVSQPANVGYLSGFTGSTAWLLITPQRTSIVTDSRYFEQASVECPDFELIKIDGNLVETLPAVADEFSLRRIGFEAEHATFANIQDWSKAAPGVEWAPTRGLVLGMRAVKDACEERLMRAAIRLADEAFVAVTRSIQEDWTERKLAWAIETYFHDHGASGAAFDTIVAGAANGAMPHAHATDAILPRGEPIVIDMGAQLAGYCSDLTRTICLGQPNDTQRFWEVYSVVLRAQQAAEATIRPGLTGHEADAAARDVISASGYGEQFGHSLGHGVGRVVHEEPGLRRNNNATLVKGNFVTVEPGIYLPGWGGVRIEDLVLVTETGAEVLSTAPKEPIVALA